MVADELSAGRSHSCSVAHACAVSSSVGPVNRISSRSTSIASESIER